MEKSIIIIIILVVAILGIGAFSLFYANPNLLNNPSNNNSNPQNNQNQTKGTIYFTVTDAAADLGNINAINATIDRVEVYSATQGWVTITRTPQTFSLLELKAQSKAQLLAQADISSGLYTQTRFHITKILVTEAGQVKEAKVPSNEFNMNLNMQVDQNAITVTKLDILADVSLHKTGKGEFIFAPVVKANTHNNAIVQVGSDNIVTTSGGMTNQSIIAGMDIDGQVKPNFSIDSNINLELNATGGIQVTNGIMLP